MNLEDKNIREILLSGEEAVSPQVWSGVARGLDKAAAASRRRVVVLWTSFVSLAAAAAVAAIVVFTPAGTKRVPTGSAIAVVEETPAVEEVTAAEVPEEAVEVPVDNVETIASQVARSHVAPAALAQNKEEEVSYVAEEESREVVSDSDLADVSGTVIAEDEPAGSVQETVVREERSEVSVQEQVSSPASSSDRKSQTVGNMDPFSLLLAEENRIGNKPTAITFSGLAQAGRTPQMNYGGSGRMGAPTVPVTGVRETGDNKFELPVSVGLGLRFPIVAGLSIGAGVNYTRLARSFTGTYTEVENGMPVRMISDVTISETQQYIGLPVNLYYDVVSNKSFQASAFAGATVERCIGLNYRIPDSGSYINYAEKPQGLQPSVVAGISLQYNFLPKFALYAEPGVRYYFDAHQSPSIRTMQPWMVNLELGLRYNLGK